MTDEPTTPEAIVDHARLTAQAQGKVMLAEMITGLDEVIAKRCDSMRAWIEQWSADGVDMAYWGRRTHVLESALSFLQRIDLDDEARDYLAQRFRRGVIRRDKIPVDNSKNRQAAQAGGGGPDIRQDR